MTRLLASATLVLACSVQPAMAQLRSELVVAGLSQPVVFVQDPSQSNVQVVGQQNGRLRVVQNGALLEQDFLDLTADVLFAGERGLLGLVFAPDYATSGRLYVSFTNLAGDTVLARFLRDASDPLRADPTSRFDFVWPDGLPYLAQPWITHKGGNLVFGPDGYLYVALGDGDQGNGPLHLAQNPASLLGKMLRLDVSVDAAHPAGYVVPPTNPFVGQEGVLPEIWAFGFRNPWRYSFDDPSRGGTGALIIADVGEAGWEEVNYEPAGQGGRNYGWRNREGAHDNVMTEPPFGVPFTDPIYEYPRSVGRSITGGFVYRGGALGGAYAGRFFFADFIRSRIWSLGLALDPSTGQATATDVLEHTGDLGNAAKNPSSFGVDANGELYVLSYMRGEIHRIAYGSSDPPPVEGSDPPPPPPPSESVCATSDPFVSLGGGICCNGGWLPPGMTCNAAPGPPAPPDAPPPSDPPPPPPDSPPVPPGPPPPPPTGAACASADPFVSLGGGTCCDGGWLPPGMACIVSAPGQPDAPPLPDPPPPPPDPGPPSPPDPGPPPDPPSPPAGGCTTPDPFEGIPGLSGICLNGGWTPVVIISGEGTVTFRPEEGGFWAIQLDDGRIVMPLDGVPESFQTEGLRMTIIAKPRPDLIGFQAPIVELLSYYVSSG